MDDISLGLYPGLRLCPLGLTTNHGLLRCPFLYCGASPDQPWTAPVSVSLLWSFSGPTMDCSGVRLFTVELLRTNHGLLRCPSLYCGTSPDQPWTAPVSVSLLWSFSGPTMNCSGVRLFTVELLRTCHWNFGPENFGPWTNFSLKILVLP